TQEHIACNDAGVKLAAEGDTTWFRAQNGGVAAPERQDGRFCKQAAQAWMERALAHGTQRFEWVERRFTGEELPMELLLTPMRYRGSVLLIAVARDISARKKTERELLELNQSLERRVAERTAALTTNDTERKRTEQALRESEEKFRALFEGSSQGVVLHDENQILEVNPAAVRIL